MCQCPGACRAGQQLGWVGVWGRWGYWRHVRGEQSIGLRPQDPHSLHISFRRIFNCYPPLCSAASSMLTCVSLLCTAASPPVQSPTLLCSCCPLLYRLCTISSSLYTTAPLPCCFLSCGSADFLTPVQPCPPCRTAAPSTDLPLPRSSRPLSFMCPTSSIASSIIQVFRI